MTLVFLVRYGEDCQIVETRERLLECGLNAIPPPLFKGRQLVATGLIHLLGIEGDIRLSQSRPDGHGQLVCFLMTGVEAAIPKRIETVQ